MLNGYKDVDVLMMFVSTAYEKMVITTDKIRYSDLVLCLCLT